MKGKHRTLAPAGFAGARAASNDGSPCRSTDRATMTTMLNAVDFAFRPIRPEEDYSGMDCGDGEAGRCSAPAGAEVAGKFRDYGDSAGFDDDDLFISDGEKLPDVTGFGARQREINEQQRAAAAAAERAVPGPCLGSTLRELCDSYGALAAAASTPPSVWAEVLATLREREETKTSWTLDPATARHMKYRATLIEWILEVCADFGFGPTTADLAVQYMVRTRSRPIFLHPADPVAARRRRVESRDPPRTPWVASPRSHLTIASPDVPAGSRPEQGERAQDLAPAGGDVLSGSCR